MKILKEIKPLGFIIGDVKIFRNGLTVMTGFNNDFRDSFPLLVIELSDRMDLVHCKG